MEYKNLFPAEKKIDNQNNPPKFNIEFFESQKNLENISCYSNEGDRWEKSLTMFKNNSLSIRFREPFKPRRGRINCSLNDNGKWRWLASIYRKAQLNQTFKFFTEGKRVIKVF